MKLFIYSKKKKTKEGREFTSYWAYMMLTVKGEESKGKQRKSVNVSFTKDTNPKNITRGVLEGEFDCPRIYEVKEKDGKAKYPTIYVTKIDKFTEQKWHARQEDLIAEDIGGEDEPSSDGETETKDDLPF